MIRYILFSFVALGCVAMVMHHNGNQTSNVAKTASMQTASKDCAMKQDDCNMGKNKSCCMMQDEAHPQTAYASLYSPAPAEEVEFFAGSWKELLAKASKEGKPFWVDVYTTWCGPCKMMAKTTFKDDAVAKTSKKSFLAYKIDAEKGDGLKVASDYNVEAYPTILFFSADGKLLGREEGMQDAERFAYTIDKYLKKVGKPKKGGKKK
jgi:thiol:disulfide interchange protein